MMCPWCAQQVEDGGRRVRIPGAVYHTGCYANRWAVLSDTTMRAGFSLKVSEYLAALRLLHETRFYGASALLKRLGFG
jgi:hypothetical protein